MAVNIQWGKATFGDPNKLGDSPTPALVPTGLFPMFKPESANTLLRYTVPAGKVMTLKNLLLNVMPPANVASAGGVVAPTGPIYLDVDGTDQFEMRLHLTPINTATIAESYASWRNQDRVMSMGEGIDFTEGQVLKVQITPLAPVAGQRLPMKLVARLHGKEVTGGATSMQIGTLRCPPTGASIDILSFTVPANGYRLFSWDVQAWLSEQICASIQVYVNGCCVVEAGYVSFDATKTTFGNNLNQGVFALLGSGCWGCKLNHGDVVEILGHAWLDYGQEAGAHMAMDETTEEAGGPGGPATAIRHLFFFG